MYLYIDLEVKTKSSSVPFHNTNFEELRTVGIMLEGNNRIQNIGKDEFIRSIVNYTETPSNNTIIFIINRYNDEGEDKFKSRVLSFIEYLINIIPLYDDILYIFDHNTRYDFMYLDISKILNTYESDVKCSVQFDSKDMFFVYGIKNGLHIFIIDTLRINYKGIKKEKNAVQSKIERGSFYEYLIHDLYGVRDLIFSNRTIQHISKIIKKVLKNLEDTDCGDSYTIVRLMYEYNMYKEFLEVSRNDIN